MRIGDLAAVSGVTAKTLRFYEQAGLLPAPPVPRAAIATIRHRRCGGCRSSVTPRARG
ncbi:MerR family DNA-binding transcriptional regulator [Streptomyces sp. ISL-99]|uniref:MerR family DNA-binding transcriptional regulator n=1 Tax=Streptomyces sp. ISL-99 TaxID=2819193 RepID=UPI0035AE719C